MTGKEIDDTESIVNDKENKHYDMKLFSYIYLLTFHAHKKVVTINK